MSDILPNAEFLTHEIPRNERTKETPPDMLPPELKAALEKVIERLQKIFAELH